MATLTLTSLDEDLLARMAAVAAAKNSTVEQQIVETLRESFGEDRHAALRRRADEIAAMTPRGVIQTDSTLLIREDRDR